MLPAVSEASESRRFWQRAWHRARLWPFRYKPRVEDDLAISPWSLRFRDAGVENGFSTSLHVEVVESTFGIGVAAAALYAFWFAASCWDGLCISTRRIFYTVSFGAEFSILTVGIVLAVAAFAEKRFAIFGSKQFERFLVVMFTLTMGVFPLTEDRLVTYMLQEGPRKFTHCHVRSLPLSICLLVVITHLQLPLRTAAIWPFQALALVWNLAVHMLASGTTGGISNNLMLIVIVVVAIGGKRAQEIQRRRLFHLMITERALRAQSEHELSRAQAGLRSSTGLDARSAASSNTSAGYLFDDSPPKNLVRTLHLLAAKGREERWLVDLPSVELAPSSVLGRGNFGTVLHASFRGAPVVLKLARRGLGAEAINRAPSILMELRVLRQISHPNIATFFGALIDPVACEVGLVLEMIAGARLDVYINKDVDHNVTDVNRLEVAFGLTCALLYMHTRATPIVHGDLQASKVMVELIRAGVRAKIVDVGLARLIAGPRHGCVAWMAPEICRTKGKVAPHTSQDVFSFGRIVHFVALGKMPFEGKTVPQIRAALLAGEIEEPECPDEDCIIPYHCWEVAAECVTLEPDERPSMERVAPQLFHYPQEVCEGIAADGCSSVALATRTDLKAWSIGIKTYRQEQRNLNAQEAAQKKSRRRVRKPRGTSVAGSLSSHSEEEQEETEGDEHPQGQLPLEELEQPRTQVVEL